MSTSEVSGRATTDPSVAHVDMNLGTFVIAVSNVDETKAFYEGLGWRLEADLGAGEGRHRALPNSGANEASWSRTRPAPLVHGTRRERPGPGIMK